MFVAIQEFPPRKEGKDRDLCEWFARTTRFIRNMRGSSPADCSVLLEGQETMSSSSSTGTKSRSWPCTTARTGIALGLS